MLGSLERYFRTVLINPKNQIQLNVEGEYSMSKLPTNFFVKDKLWTMRDGVIFKNSKHSQFFMKTRDIRLFGKIYSFKPLLTSPRRYYSI